MNNNSFLISVIIPVYNAEQYLKRCMDSVIGQTYTKLEIIAVNDGSTDNSGKILDEYAKQDSRVKVIHQPNGGQASARNAALDCATGDLIANLDSDDYLELHAYETVIKNFDDDVDMVWFGNHVVGDADEKHMASQREFYRMKELGKMPLSKVAVVARSGAVWNKVVRRNIIEKYKLRYPEGVIFEDLCFCACLYPLINNVNMLEDKLYFYMQRADSTMGIARSKSSEKSMDALRGIAPMYNFYKKNNLLASAMETYEAFFIKFVKVSHAFIPQQLSSKLLDEVHKSVAEYGPSSQKAKNYFLSRILNALYGTPIVKISRFLGLRLFYEKKSWNYVSRRILGIRVYEKVVSRNAVYKKTLFYKDTANTKAYCFFGIPIYSRKKDATRAKKLFGITISKKKTSTKPSILVKAQISYLSPNQRLAGKKIIITGGGRGLGYAMAKKFVAEGAEILIAGRNVETLKEKAAELNCHYLPLDVQNASSFTDFIAKADELLGGADSLVNNAGISLHEGNIRNVSHEQFDMQIATNLRGAYFLAQEFIKLFEKQGRKTGNLLFISSERGSYVDDLPYGLTKVATNSLVQGLANRLLKSGIRVNAVAPGVTTSDMTGFKADGNLYCSYNINKRVYLPEEVAEVACFIMSDAAKCLNGQILVCNEGKTINAHWRL